MTEKHRFDLLADTRTCYRYLQIGFGVIVVTFVLGVTVLFVPDLIPVYEILVMPALFIGDARTVHRTRDTSIRYWDTPSHHTSERH